MAEPAFRTHQNTAPRYKPRHHNAMPHDTAHIRVPFLGMSLRRITAARASRRRPATHGTADGRCHAAPPPYPSRRCHRCSGGMESVVCSSRTLHSAVEHTHHHETRYEVTINTQVPKISGPLLTRGGRCRRVTWQNMQTQREHGTKNSRRGEWAKKG